jgi:hypothetical protein
LNVKLPLDITPITDGLRGISETMRAIRDSVALLPEVAATLEDIREGVKAMGDEVHTMRRAVDALGVEVTDMRTAMVDHLDLVAARVEGLEPRLEDLSLAIHPLRRATGRLGRRRAANGELPDEDAQTSSGENVSQDAGSAEE